MVTRQAINLSPNITVVGIAGLGDPLASEHVFNTFRLIDLEFSSLIKCMSTNGLLLPYHIGDLLDVGLDTLTVTVNAIDPLVVSKLCDFVNIKEHVYYGIEGAEILVEHQLDGIKKAAKEGIMIKINTILVPGVNEDQISLVSKVVSQAGAVLHNIIPLIPCGKMTNYPRPTDEQLKRAREESEKHISVFKNCHQCRADAIGIPGKDDIGTFIYSQRNMKI